MIKHDLHYRRLPSGFPEIQYQDISGAERDDKGGLCHYLRRFWRSLEQGEREQGREASDGLARGQVLYHIVCGRQS